MIEFFVFFYKVIGIGNLLTLLTFGISTLIAYYLYFKTFYRLVYSIKTKPVENLITVDGAKPESVFCSRIIFYNNGRKSLSKEHIHNLQIISPFEILDSRQIITNEKIQLKQYKKNIKLNFNNLDTKNYVIIDVVHKGKISIEGRVSESGKLVNTETKFWFKVNVVALLFIATLMFIPFIFSFNNILFFIPNLIISAFLINIILYGTKYIHQLFFIPDKLILKHLEIED